MTTFTSTRNLSAAVAHIVAPANDQNLDPLGAEVDQGGASAA